MAANTSKMALCWPNRIDEATVSGGTWDASFPIENLQNDNLTVTARSTTTTANIVIQIPTREIQSVALANHNLSATSTWQVRLYSDSAGSTLVYDSTAVNAFPLSADDAAIYPALTYMFLTDPYNVQRVEIDIIDASNVDGYIELGRVFIASLWQSTINMSYKNFQTGLDVRTKSVVALDGITEYYDAKPPRRTAAFTLPALTREEAYLQVEKMQRTLGLHGELLWAKDLLGDSTERSTTFLATLMPLSPITHPFLNRHAVKIGLKEKR